MPLEFDKHTKQSSTLSDQALHLQNPWTRELYRCYQAELKYSPSLIAQNESEILAASRTLEYLHSEMTRNYLEAYPEKSDVIENRKRRAIACINRNKAVIANHQAAMRSMRDRLIRYGFLDERGNPIYEVA